MSQRRLRRLLAVAALALLGVIGSAIPAGAHAVLEKSDPANNATLERAPGQIALSFSEPVEIPLGSVQVIDCAGGRVEVGRPQHGDTRSEVVASLPEVPPSLYLVRWRVLSADAHPVQGAFSFGVGTGTTNSADCAAAGAGAGASGSVGVLFGIARFGVFAGLALLIGGVTFLVLIARGTSASSRTRTLVWIGWSVTVLTTIAAVMLQGPYAAGTGLGDAARWSVVSDILSTRYGHIAELRLVVLLLAVPLIVYERRVSERRPLPVVWMVLASALGLVLSATPGLAGHAATGEWTVFAVPIDAIHVAAMSVWFGGLVALIVSALGGGFSGGLRRALIRFSALATTCVVVLVVSGLFASWRQVGFSFDAYSSTAFGRLLLGKVGIVIGLVALAAISRQIVRRRRAAPLDAPDSVIAAVDEQTVTGLRRTVGGEVVVGVAVLALTALLVQAVPARSDVTPELFDQTITAGRGSSEILVNVTVDPATVGPNAVHVTVFKPDGTNMVVREITGDFSLPAQGVERLPANLIRAGGNHFIVDNLPITIAGEWNFVVHVLISAFTDVAAVFNVPIQ